MRPDLRRMIRFGLVGLTTTATTYLIFRLSLAGGLHYLLASTLSWLCGMAASYLLNRRFTFAVQTGANLAEAGRFLSGGLMQFAIGTGGYVIMIGVMKINPSAAFVVNVGVGCVFNFCYMRWIVFRPSSHLLLTQPR